MKTYEYQNALRDAADLTSSEKLVGLVMSTYGETIWASPRTLAKECRLHLKTVRAALKKLVSKGWLEADPRPGQTTIYTPTLPKSSPTQMDTLPKSSPGLLLGNHPPQMDTPHPTQMEPPKRERKRERKREEERREEVDTRETRTPAAPSPPPCPEENPFPAAAPVCSWAEAWTGVWQEVCGPAPMPNSLELSGFEEARFATALAKTASRKRAGRLGGRSAHDCFRMLLRRMEAQELGAWTPEAVRRELEGEPEPVRPVASFPRRVASRHRQRPIQPSSTVVEDMRRYIDWSLERVRQFGATEEQVEALRALKEARKSEEARHVG